MVKCANTGFGGNSNRVEVKSNRAETDHLLAIKKILYAIRKDLQTHYFFSGIFWYLLVSFIRNSPTIRYQKIPKDTQSVLLSIGNLGTKRYQKIPLDTTTFFLTGNFSAIKIVMLLIDRGLTLLQIIYYIFNIIYNSIR